MPLQPFTPAGVSAKISELYALSDSLLFAQADSVESDFGNWIKANFSLTAAQITYLSGMSSHVTKYFGSQCSMAFRSRLSISLTVGTMPIEPSTKWVKSENTLVVATNSAGAIETSGTLTFKVEYRS